MSLSTHPNTFIINIKVITICLIGDALTWASTVKDSPMPMEYQLVSIEELLSNTYLPKINSDTLANLKEKLIAAKPKYCQYLVDKGEAQDCHSEISIQSETIQNHEIIHFTN